MYLDIPRTKQRYVYLAKQSLKTLSTLLGTQLTSMFPTEAETWDVPWCRTPAESCLAFCLYSEIQAFPYVQCSPTFCCCLFCCSHSFSCKLSSKMQNNLSCYIYLTTILENCFGISHLMIIFG